MAQQDPYTRPTGFVPSVADLLSDLEAMAAAAEVSAPEVSARTRRAYESDWRAWVQWCDLHELSALPVDPTLVRLYVVDMDSQVRSGGVRRYSTATIERHLAALSWHSRQAGGVHDLSRHPVVAPVLAGVRARRPARTRHTRPMTDADLGRVLVAMPRHVWPAGVATARDTAALLTARSAGLGRSDMSVLTLSDVADLSPARAEPAARCPRCAAHRWLVLLAAPDRVPAMALVLDDRRGHVCGEHLPLPEQVPGSSPFLRAVTKDGRIEARAVSDSALAQMFKRRLVAAGVDASRYGFGSLRARPAERRS